MSKHWHRLFSYTKMQLKEGKLIPHIFITRLCRKKVSYCTKRRNTSLVWKTAGYAYHHAWRFLHIHFAETTRSSSLRNCLFEGEEDEDIALQKWFLRTGGQSESWMTMTQFAFCFRIERGDFFFSLSLSPSLGESSAPSSAQRTRQSSFLFSFSVHTTWIVLLSDFVFFLHSSHGPTANMEPLCRQSYTIFE